MNTCRVCGFPYIDEPVRRLCRACVGIESVPEPEPNPNSVLVWANLRANVDAASQNAWGAWLDALMEQTCRLVGEAMIRGSADMYADDGADTNPPRGIVRSIGSSETGRRMARDDATRRRIWRMERIARIKPRSH